MLANLFFMPTLFPGLIESLIKNLTLKKLLIKATFMITSLG